MSLDILDWLPLCVKYTHTKLYRRNHVKWTWQSASCVSSKGFINHPSHQSWNKQEQCWATEWSVLNKEDNVEKTKMKMVREDHRDRGKDVLMAETRQGNADRICNLTKQSWEIQGTGAAWVRTAGRLNRREAKTDNTVNTGKKQHTSCAWNRNRMDSSRYTK